MKLSAKNEMMKFLVKNYRQTIHVGISGQVTTFKKCVFEYNHEITFQQKIFVGTFRQKSLSNNTYFRLEYFPLNNPSISF